MKFSNNPIKAAGQAEKYWLAKKEKYLWLGPGWHWRENPNFKLDKKKLKVKKKPPREGYLDLRKSIAEFYNKFVFSKRTVGTERCCVTRGCEECIRSGLEYFKSRSKKKILYLVPTYGPLIEISKKKGYNYVEVGQYNESWDSTLKKIEKAIGKDNVGCIVIANPNNPSGIMYPYSFFKKLSRICNKHKVWILEDGAYFLHFDKKHRQTSVIRDFDYAISVIGTTKLFTSLETKVGGAVLSDKLDVKEFSKFIGKMDSRDELWFEHMLRKVLRNPSILKEHLNYAYSVSEKIIKAFIGAGFKPLFYSLEKKKKKYPVGPVTSLKFKNKKGKKIFKILANNKIVTQFVNTKRYQGVRINTRAFYKEDLPLLGKALK